MRILDFDLQEYHLFIAAAENVSKSPSVSVMTYLRMLTIGHGTLGTRIGRTPQVLSLIAAMLSATSETTITCWSEKVSFARELGFLVFHGFTWLTTNTSDIASAS